MRNTLKQFIAFTLATALLLCDVDLGFVDLSTVVAQAATAVTDAYETYEGLTKVVGKKVNVEGTQSSSGDLSTYTPVNDSFSWSNLSSNLITFNQSSIEGTVQVKSGAWLTDTDYEAMAGTPTTENLFVTMGGTQWIVDLQYRYVTAPYLRRYHFDASCANYRYYKLGNVNHTFSGNKTGGNAVTAKYIASASVKYDEKLEDYSKVTLSNGKTKYNYAYKFFEGARDKDSIETVSYTLPSGTVTHNGKNKVTANKVDGFLNADGTPSSAKVADVNINVGNTYTDSSSTSYVTPDVAQAIALKQNIWDSLFELKEMWIAQDDNYRADQGAYNTDEDSYIRDNYKPDELSFMYTYAGMCRHTSAQGRTVANDGTSANVTAGSTARPAAGSSFKNSGLWTPVITSYFFDWNSYKAHNTMTTSYGSDIVVFNKVSDYLNASYMNSFRLGLLTQIVNYNSLSSVGMHDISKKYFALEPWDWELYEPLNADAKSTTYSVLPTNYTLAKTAIENGAGENVLVALNDIGNAYAFGFELDGATMGIGSNETGDLGSEPFYYKGYSELGYFYYRAVYNVLINYGCLFYADEAKVLFDGIPGFNASNINTTEYNKKVNINLAAIFGTGWTYESENAIMSVSFPFAIFPLGGDLDGGMEDETSTSASTVSDFNSANEIACTPVVEPQYIYAVTIDLYTSSLHSYSDAGRSTSTTYAYEKHGDGSTANNITKCDGAVLHDSSCNSKKEVRCTRCNGDGIRNDNTTEETKCTRCNGTGVIRCTYTTKTHAHTWIENRQLASGCNATKSNHEDRIYTEEVNISVSHKVTKSVDEPLNSSDGICQFVETPKSMSDHQVIGQLFENVQWLDITSYTLWQMNSGTMKGLSALLVSPASANNVSSTTSNSIVTKAVDQMGYTVYNLDDTSSVTNLTGSYTGNGWYKAGRSSVLEKAGRIANSFNIGSDGNTVGCETLKSFRAHTDSEGWDHNGNKYSSGDSYNNMVQLYAYRASDAPQMINTGGLIYVNEDPFAYTVHKETTDDLYFVYNPYRQGGRSHTTFYGFVSQALAHTLYSKVSDMPSGFVSSKAEAVAYANSVRVQGDYLAINRTDNSKLTITGMLYDTWDERINNKYSYSGSIFKLIPDGYTDLSPYYSTCPWVPARLSFLLPRAGRDTLYCNSNGVDSTNNCWIIHTFCRGINGANHVSWDCSEAYVDLSGGSRFVYCDGMFCSYSADIIEGAITNKGDINPHRNATLAATNTTSLPAELSGFKYDTSKTVKLKDILASGDNPTVSVIVDGETCLCTDITLDNYLQANQNTETMQTMTNLSMPYIGYQSKGNGTSDITLDGTNGQAGYSAGTDTKFKPLSTYVTPVEELTYDGGFLRFGVKPASEPVTVKDTIRGNINTEAGASDFTAKYPWLSGLNVNRYLQNGLYNTGNAYINYNKVTSDDDGTLSSQKKTHSTSSTLSVPAHYLKGSSSSKGYPNNIVIYNPVTTERSMIVPLSEYLPDAGNVGLDKNDKATYSGAYLDSFATVALRDQRIANKQQLESSTGSEDYLVGNGVATAVGSTVIYSRYVLRAKSEITTEAYMQSDYTVTSTVLTDSIKQSEYATKHLSITKTGRYDITLKTSKTSTDMSVSIDLQEGDTLKYANNAVMLTMGSNNFELPYSSFKEAYTAWATEYGTEEDLKYNISGGIPLTDTMSVTVGANMQLRKGSLIKLTLSVANENSSSTEAIDDALELVVPSGCKVYKVPYNEVKSNANGKYSQYVWYLEATDETYVAGLSLKVNKNCYLLSYDGNALECQDVMLMSIGNASEGTAKAVEGATTIGFLYESSSYHISTTSTYYASYNNCVDIRGSIEISGIDVSIIEGIYMSLNNGQTNVSLNDDAYNNPHKVPNTDWRFYVLGWTTVDGNVIESVSDSYLYDNSTTLQTPVGGTVTVGELISKSKKNTLGVYSYNGTYGLIDVASDGTYKHESVYTGITLTSESLFDMVSFGDVSQTITGTVMPSSTIAKTVETYTKDEYYYMHEYEEVFLTTSASSYSEIKITNIAYSVRFSLNLAHRISIDATSSSLFAKDWDTEEVTKPVFSTSSFDSPEDSISLDDEFTIYWDNFADIDGNGASNIASCSNTVGRGWNNLDDSREDLPGGKFCNSALLGSNWSKPTGVTDTTKWIYNKYIVFSVDMYGFTTGNSFTLGTSGHNTDTAFDPTTPAYKSNGTPNNIVYIPAGTPVYLGYYSANSNSADNTGKFIDYGYNKGATKDPNGNFYTYHFWCPLSDGESVQGASVKFVVNAINSVDSNTAGGTAKTNSSKRLYTEDCLIGLDQGDTDEWGSEIICAGIVGIPNNLRVRSNSSAQINETNGVQSLSAMVLQNTTRRYNNSVSGQAFSITGRIGGLTVVDTGDPRYQDTFKTASDEWEYAITPVVRAIERYSNDKDTYGTQKKYLSDLTDVRGRLLENTVTTTSSNKSVTTGTGNYKYNLSESMDTYQSQWFMSTSGAIREALPLSAEFNDHEEFTSSLIQSKLGYEIYCSLETIGNYFGSSEARPGQEDDYSKASNNNLDYGQTKIQIQPTYIALDTNTGKTYAVDVYMRSGTSYQLINSGCSYASESDEKGKCSVSKNTQHSYYLDVAYDATYTSTIKTNTGSSVTDLDQNMERRMVTDDEAQITNRVLTEASTSTSVIKSSITTSLLNSHEYTETEEIGAEGLDSSYVYGNAQMLFLRECNRTFVGGSTLALNIKESSDIQEWLRNAEKYAQKWYFGLSLPANAVFVKHGSDLRESNFLNGEAGIYILCTINTYAIGEKWILHYDSNLSEMAITVNDEDFPSAKWNVHSDAMPNLIPVSIYDMGSTTAVSDKDTHGTH